MSLPTQPTTLKECTSCSTNNVTVLHNVRHRGINRRICTSCVLRLHPASFCPTCFQLHYPTPPHPHKRITCSNCNSISHSDCVPTITSHAAPPAPQSATPYLCPPCASPDFVFFETDKFTEGPRRSADKKRSAVLLCAVRIVLMSMGKAVNVGRAVAERKIRESAVAGKRTKVALDHA